MIGKCGGGKMEENSFGKAVCWNGVKPQGLKHRAELRMEDAATNKAG